MPSGLTFLLCFQSHGDNVRASVGLTHGQGSDELTTDELQGSHVLLLALNYNLPTSFPQELVLQVFATPPSFAH